ncbi:MAG: hypothetical protein [Caudoviricetes sp.]|nr:MAG: hypothetical protein [Caudoviricetes sp.]
MIIDYVTNPRTAMQFHYHLVREMIRELEVKHDIRIAHHGGRFVIGAGKNQSRVGDIIRSQIRNWNHTVVSTTICSNGL